MFSLSFKNDFEVFLVAAVKNLIPPKTEIHLVHNVGSS